MKQEALSPYIGKKITVYDIMGSDHYGELENVDENSIVLITKHKNSATRNVVATEFIASFTVEE